MLKWYEDKFATKSSRPPLNPLLVAPALHYLAIKFKIVYMDTTVVTGSLGHTKVFLVDIVV